MAIVWFFFALKNQNKALVAQTYLVGLSHCVVRVMWFRYCILPEAVLLSSQLFHETTGVNRIRHSCLSLTLMAIISFFKERQYGRFGHWHVGCMYLNWPVRQVVVKETTAVNNRTSGPNSISGLKTYFTVNKDNRLFTQSPFVYAARVIECASSRRR